ncbi:MAG TPA: hypothetical protein VFT12_00615 [Thermoanaerobaculia bacterium]|nr:hypothetical protein [Thermoanaerobaculia bacterium]
MHSIILTRRSDLMAAILRDATTGRHLAAIILTISIGGAIYGAALGAWHGPRLAAYVSLKIPILLLGTAGLTSLFNWIIAALLGLPLRFRQTVALSLLPLAVVAVIVASLAPALLFFAQSLPAPSIGARTQHNLMYLIHVGVVAAAGLAGTSTLRSVLLAVAQGRERLARRVRLAWVGVFAFVGGELAWALRPFVGSVYLPVVFLRDEALSGNVYEFIISDILPHLWRRLCSC